MRVFGGGRYVHPPFCRGVEPLTKFSKKGGALLAGSLFLEGDCWERGGDFFERGCRFYINKLTSEIIKDI